MGLTTNMNEKPAQPHFIENFIQGLESWVRIPQYEDPDLQRKAEIIHILSSMVLMIGLGTLTITPFIFENPTTGVSITMGIMLVIFLVQVLNRKARTQVAALLFITAVWAFDTGIILFSGGFKSQFFSSYIAIAIMGGLILGEMYAFHLAGISTAAYLALYFLDVRGLTPTPLIEFTPIAIILINIANLFLAATVLILIMLRYDQYFRELTNKEITLKSTNLELQAEIKAREEAESLLRLSENRLKSSLMELPFPTMLHAENGEILLVNSAWIQSTGHAPQDLPKFKDWLDHMFRENSPQIVAILDQLIRGEASRQEGFFDIYKNNGESLKWYTSWNRLPDLADGRTLILTTATDMTGFLSIESALRESEETLSVFSLVTNDGMWDWDLKTDQVTFDPRYYTMAGYEVDEFPYELEEFRRRVHPDDVDHVFREAEAHLQGEIDRFNVEFRFLKKDGSWLWIMGRGKITEQDEVGNPLRFVGTHTDISAQKAIEDKLSDYQLQLEDVVDDRTQELNERITEVERLNIALTNILDDYQAANERLSLLGDNLTAANQELESLTYSLSTDLLRPILTIQDKAKKIIRKSANDLNEGELEALIEIQSSAALVNQQINDLLQISQLSQQELSLEDIDPAKVVKKIFKSYSKEIKENKIETIVKDLPICRADPDLLELVFEILISNGIKYTAGQETPVIRVGYQPDPDPNRVIYYVRDNGIGFNPDAHDVVFSKFQKLDNLEDDPGSGIGLTLAKLIINKHNGSIWAESEEGKGATFYFDLFSPKTGES